MFASTNSLTLFNCSLVRYWNAYAEQLCTSSISGEYVVLGATKTGLFAAMLPQIQVNWTYEELSLLTSASAPLKTPSTYATPAATLSLSFPSSSGSVGGSGTSSSHSASYTTGSLVGAIVSSILKLDQIFHPILISIDT